MRSRFRSDPTVDVLTRVALLERWPRRLLQDVARHTDVIDLPAGSRIDRAGTRARQFVGILDGYVMATSESGSCTLIGPSGQIGADELASGRHHRCTYTAVTATRAVIIFGPEYRSRDRLVRRAASSAGTAPDPLTAQTVTTQRLQSLLTVAKR